MASRERFSIWPPVAQSLSTKQTAHRDARNVLSWKINTVYSVMTQATRMKRSTRDLLAARCRSNWFNFIQSHHLPTIVSICLSSFLCSSASGTWCRWRFHGSSLQDVAIHLHLCCAFVTPSLTLFVLFSTFDLPPPYNPVIITLGTWSPTTITRMLPIQPLWVQCI